VASKDGVQTTEGTTVHRPIIYTTYDNLDEATQVQEHDGDGVTITSTGGVPNAPAASLLRAQSNVSYDDQGRVYQTQTYSVNPTTGAVSSTTLTTNVFLRSSRQCVRNQRSRRPGVDCQHFAGQ
jgi:hypothetical protein